MLPNVFQNRLKILPKILKILPIKFLISGFYATQGITNEIYKFFYNRNILFEKLDEINPEIEKLVFEGNEEKCKAVCLAARRKLVTDWN